MNLKTKVGNIIFDPPLLLASGYITETPDFFVEANKFGCSGMVTRSLKKNVPPERKNTPAPRYVVDDINIMLNCEWGNEHPWENWRDKWAEQVRNKAPLIISMSGRDIEGCKELIQIFDEVGVDGFEINVSCSHSGSLNGNLNIDIQHLKNLLKIIRPLTTQPIWIKLAFSSILIEMAKTAEDLGADAITCTNTIGPGLAIDIETAKPKLGIKGGLGGVSGKAIFPIALHCVNEISKNVQIPIVGVGGICTADNVIQMLMAGASAVQLYTFPALKGPESFKKISDELLQFLFDHPEYPELSSVIGAFNQIEQEHQFQVSSAPVVVKDRCSGCGICLSSCAFGAIHLNKNSQAEISDDCIGCNACAGGCPPKFNAILPAR